VYLGAEYRGPHGDHLTPITPRELAIAVPLLALAILFGVYPQVVFNYMEPSVTQGVKDLAEWTKDVKQPELDAARQTQLSLNK
jgi:NADH-quinone oxidoreductase subunit M